MANNTTVSSVRNATFDNSSLFLSNLTSSTNKTRSSSTAGICLNDDTDGILAAKALAYTLVILASLVGNSLIVALVFKNQRMKTPVNFFIVNMAISDLMITVFFMPRMLTRIFYGVEWQVSGTTGLILCKISPSMQELCSSLSVLLFMAISVDRFFAVVFPLKKIITQKVAYGMIAGIWFIALAARFPTFYYLNLYYIRTNVYCAIVFRNKVLKDIYQHFSFVIFYAVPLCIVVILYTAVIVALKKRKRPGATSLTQQSNQLKRTHRVLKMLVTVVISFSICWFLYFCLPVLIPHMDYQIACDLFFWRFFLCHLNCAFNPMVYLISIENYRHGVRHLVTSAFSRVCPKGFCINSVSPDDECSTSEMRTKQRRGRVSTEEVENKSITEMYQRDTSPL